MNIDSPRHDRMNESGSAIFFIFIAVALLAALSFAVSQSSRSSGKSLTEDRARLAASEVIAYGDTVAKSIGQLRLRGITETGIRFSHPDADPAYGVYDTTPRAEIFNPQGGGVLFRKPPPLAVSNSTATYVFTGENAVESIGADCGTADCNELLITLSNVKPEVCQFINYILGYAGKSDPLPDDSDMGMTPFAGTYAVSDTISDESSFLSGKTAGCHLNAGTGENVYYQVLIAR